MEIEDFSFDHDHLMGDSATHPMAPLATRLEALLLLVGRRPLRVVAPTQMRRQRPTRARPTEESRMIFSLHVDWDVV